MIKTHCKVFPFSLKCSQRKPQRAEKAEKSKIKQILILSFFLSYHFIPPRCNFYFYEHNCHIFPRVTTNRQEGSQEEKSGPACPTLSLILYCLHQFGCCWRVLKTPEETADNNITHLGVTFCLQFESH